MNLTPLNRVLKMAKMVNVMLCVIYHNFFKPWKRSESFVRMTAQVCVRVHRWTQPLDMARVGQDRDPRTSQT